MAMVESCPRDRGQRLDSDMTTLLVSNMGNDTLCGKVNPMTLNDLGLPQGEIGVSLTQIPLSPSEKFWNEIGTNLEQNF